MRWQDADLTRLPQALVQKLASGNYRQAMVGSCPAHGHGGLVYGVPRGGAAVLKARKPAAAEQKGGHRREDRAHRATAASAAGAAQPPSPGLVGSILSALLKRLK